MRNNFGPMLNLFKMRLSDSEKQILEMAAKDCGVTMTDYVRNALGLTTAGGEYPEPAIGRVTDETRATLAAIDGWQAGPLIPTREQAMQELADQAQELGMGDD